MEVAEIEIERSKGASGRKKEAMRFPLKDLRTGETIAEATLREIAYSSVDTCREGRYSLESRLYQARRQNKRVTMKVDGREACIEWLK